MLQDDLEEKTEKDFIPMEINNNEQNKDISSQAVDQLTSFSDFKTLKFERLEKDSAQIGILSVARPDKLNALNVEVLRELKCLISELKNMPLHGLILTGAGEKAFIAGADIAEMAPMLSGEAQAFSELGQQVTILIEELPYPVIGAVNGYALGGGLEMALSCDFIFSTTNAVMGLPEVKLGLIPGFGGTLRLTEAVGVRKAREMMFSGRNIKVDEALNNGLIVRTYETKEKLIEGCESWIKELVKTSPHSLKTLKKMMSDLKGSKRMNALERERKDFSNLFQTPQMKEGTQAFMEKRSPQFDLI